MKIRTLIDLNQALNDQLAWRKKELHQLKDAVQQHRNSRKEDVSVRAGIAMLYAHWEGFIKGVASAYMEYVSRRHLIHSELADCFLAVAIRPMLQQAAGRSRIESHAQIVRFLREQHAAKSMLPHDKTIQTRSNLNSDVLSDIIATLGLDFAPFETKRVLIDEKLVASRNNIAHGQYLLASADDYILLHEEVVKLMEEFHKQVEEAAIGQKYRRRTVAPASPSSIPHA